MALFLIVPEMVLTGGEDLVVIKFAPPDLRTHSSKLPFLLDSFVPHSGNPMSMTLDRNFLRALVGLSLMRYSQLMRSNNLIIADLLPCTEPNKVLRLQ